MFPKDHPYKYDLRGFYIPDDRIYRILEAEATVDGFKMLDACAMRLHRRNDPKEPIDNVAFAFMKPEHARANLYELWVRGLECRTFDNDGKEIRLDFDYVPPPYLEPDWVKRARAKDGL